MPSPNIELETLINAAKQIQPLGDPPHDITIEIDAAIGALFGQGFERDLVKKALKVILESLEES